MRIWLVLPILGVLIILQTALFSQVKLLQGHPDLLLVVLIAWTLNKQVRDIWLWGLLVGLLVGFVSTVPIGVTLAGYLAAVALAAFFRRRVWQLPLLAMLLTTFLASVILYSLEWGVLWFGEARLPFGEAFNLVTLPSTLLNLILAVPVYAVFSDLARWIYPAPLEK